MTSDLDALNDPLRDRAVKQLKSAETSCRICWCTSS
jgi:hypothetical protein